jgi:dTDP-L-rhamnose 4-epimerase
VASSMSIYGEGAYECPRCGRVYTQLRPEEQLARRDWEVQCAQCGALLRPVPTPEDKPIYPASIYAITKRDHEEMLLTFGRAYKIPAIALRFFNVYGPRQALSNPYTGLGAIFSSRLLNGKPPIVFEDGRQSRDFVHVSDIVQAVVLALDTDAVAYDVFNVGTGHPTSVLEMAAALAREIGADIAPTIRQEFRAGDIRHCYADPSRAAELLGFHAQTTLEAGMTELIEWLAGQEATDKVEAATAELVSRGLAR